MTALHTTSTLRSRGMTARQIRSAVDIGMLRRLRVGQYASGPHDEPLEAAIAFGATLTCASALQRKGVWVLERTEHLRLDQSGHQSRGALRGARRVHWGQGTSLDGVDDVATALLCAQRCMGREALLCSIDSALHQRRITRSHLGFLSGTSEGRWALRSSDARSESGLETLPRVRLRRLGIRVRPQVPFPGVGRVDLLIGDRLVLELDGDEWHSTPESRESDRRRDAALIAMGCLPLRAGFTRVVHHWPALERQVLEIVRRDEHHWHGRRRREALDVPGFG
ncbi:endonuclease domain-containing protein [Schumannella sp. 10F1B-5-1]|uniref:endonuclease domain-containing protein n=1 Tax=Schumannella sp. 10F1B-5-1 TaxID=2590780 RepID=UPI001130E0CF|nr:hypothetical protein [Schumannella sp. 10F1B-5-1]TPW70113.1 hypothetical protein FJ658_13880 [Schumannella sp. 10F1B-5-1]